MHGLSIRVLLSSVLYSMYAEIYCTACKPRYISTVENVNEENVNEQNVGLDMLYSMYA